VTHRPYVTRRAFTAKFILRSLFSGQRKHSFKSLILAEVRNDESVMKYSLDTIVQSENASESIIEDEPDIFNPLFLQMDMLVSSGCGLQREVIPLKNNFVTSIHELGKVINTARSVDNKLSKLKLDNSFIVQLNLKFKTIPGRVLHFFPNCSL